MWHSLAAFINNPSVSGTHLKILKRWTVHSQGSARVSTRCLLNHKYFTFHTQRNNIKQSWSERCTSCQAKRDGPGGVGWGGGGTMTMTPRETERRWMTKWTNHFSSFITPASALALSCSKRSRRIEHQPCTGAVGRHTQPLPSHCAEVYAPSTHAVLFWSHLMKHSQKLGCQV